MDTIAALVSQYRSGNLTQADLAAELHAIAAAAGDAGFTAAVQQFQDGTGDLDGVIAAAAAAAAATAVSDGTSGDQGTGSGGGTTAGIAVGVAVACLAAVALLWFVVVYRKQRRQQQLPTPPNAATGDGGANNGDGNADGRGMVHHDNPMRRADQGSSSHGPSTLSRPVSARVASLELAASPKGTAPAASSDHGLAAAVELPSKKSWRGRAVSMFRRGDTDAGDDPNRQQQTSDLCDDGRVTDLSMQ